MSRVISKLCMVVMLYVMPFTMLSQESVDTLSTVTVTAIKQSAKITSATPVQLLYADRLAELGVDDLADAVRRFAGVNVRDYGGVGGLKTISVRNMGAAHTGVCYDGVPVSNCQGGQIDLGRFSMDNVQMLSLAVGHDNDPLQPAKMYASAAVLNISTITPSFKDGKDYSGRFEVKGGSFGYGNASARLSGKIGNVTLGIDANFMHADGKYPFTLVNGQHTSTERRINSDINSWQVEGNVYYHPSESRRLNIKLCYYSSLRGLPGAVVLYNPVSTERLWDRNAFLQSVFTTSLSASWRLRTILKYNYGFNRDTEKGNQFTGGLYKDVHLQHEAMGSVAAHYSPLSAISVSLAQDGYVNTLSSTMGECPFPTRLTSLTALNIRWRPWHLDINATLLNTYISEHVKRGNRPSDRERLLPALSLAYKPFKNENLYIRAMWKETFRVPSFNDLYYDRLGNVNLRPERAMESGLGVTFSHSFNFFLKNLSITADGYYNTVRDKIVAFPTTYAWHMANYGRVRITGFDVTLSATFAITHKMGLDVSAAYTHQKAVDVTSRDTKNYGQQLPYTPRNSGNVGLTFSSPWFIMGYSMVAVGEKYFMSQNIPANLIDGYAEHNITISHKFDFRKLNLTVRGEIINLADAHYEIIKFYPMPGRTWRITAAVEF